MKEKIIKVCIFGAIGEMSANKPPISTHILDTTRGQPAVGVEVSLIWGALILKINAIYLKKKKNYVIVTNHVISSWLTKCQHITNKKINFDFIHFFIDYGAIFLSMLLFIILLLM